MGREMERERIGIGKGGRKGERKGQRKGERKGERMGDGKGYGDGKGDEKVDGKGDGKKDGKGERRGIKMKRIIIINLYDFINISGPWHRDWNQGGLTFSASSPLSAATSLKAAKSRSGESPEKS